MANEVILVGVGHVFRLSEKIKEIIDEESPDAVAVELDEFRANALANDKDKAKKSKRDFLYFLLAMSQNIISKKFGNVAGNEMLAAIKTAVEKSIPVYYIDVDVQKTIKKLRHALSIRKKLSLICSLLLSMFIRRKDIEKEVMSENAVENLLKTLEKEYPEIKEILIDERNRYMVEKIKEILKIHKKIVAVVGEGHIYGMKRLLHNENISIKVVHLRDLLIQH